MSAELSGRDNAGPLGRTVFHFIELERNPVTRPRPKQKLTVEDIATVRPEKRWAARFGRKNQRQRPAATGPAVRAGYVRQARQQLDTSSTRNLICI
ncbi:hypothetical protein EVAR_66896_1 [Eumeta japonica]|uniref:Uncharacterized protein n=1 Tax=Eumeta variegata TaxID=151549 RepID=A0A4C2AGR5_EUMVA|nr:hypothetical protein EVAR_66896_1 [Eumeta japonica]